MIPCFLINKDIYVKRKKNNFLNLFIISHEGDHIQWEEIYCLVGRYIIYCSSALPHSSSLSLHLHVVGWGSRVIWWMGKAKEEVETVSRGSGEASSPERQQQPEPTLYCRQQAQLRQLMVERGRADLGDEGVGSRVCAAGGN